MHIGTLICSAGLTALLIQAGPAYGQESGNEIIVTAQKRDQSSQDVGIAITAFNAETIENLGLTSSTDVAALSPGVQVNYANGLSSFSFNIRGVTQTDFADHQEAPVAVYVDDVYVAQMASAGFQMFDIERVEVLRGPQGTLFGRNATGGLIHYISKKPGDTASGYAEISYGSFDEASLEGAVTAPLSPGISSRLSLKYRRNDGYIKNTSGPDGNAQEDFAGRLQLAADLGDRAELLLKLYGAESKVKTPQYWKNAAATVGPNGVGVFVAGDISGDVHKGAWNLDGGYRIKTYGGSGTLKIDFDPVELVAITDYGELKKTYLSDADEGANSTLLHFGADNKAHQFSQELRIGGKFGEENYWVLGGYFLDIGGAYQSNFVAPQVVAFAIDPAFNSVFNEFELDTRSYALFGQVDYVLTPGLTLTGGLRWTYERKTFSYVNNAAVTPDILNPYEVDPSSLFPIGVFNEPLNGKDARFRDSFWSAKLALSYRPTEDWLVYASWNRGVKAGSFNAPVFLLPPDEMKFGNEVLDAYEIGFKSNLADRRIRFNATAFYYDYADIQAYQLEGFTQVIRNKDGRTKGAEVELGLEPGGGLSFLLGASYLDARIRNVSAGTAILDARPQMSPEWNLSGFARYKWDMPGGEMAVSGDFNYVAKHFFDLSNADVVRQKAYFVANARISYQSENGWELAAYVRNIGDRFYATWAYDIAAFAGVIEKTYARPRTWGISLRYAFE